MGKLATGSLAVALAGLACKSPDRLPAHASTSTEAPPPHCQILRDRLCAEFGRGSDVCTMAETETASYAPERCAALLGRYDETAASALRFSEAKRALVARDPRTPHGPAPSLGPPDAAVTLVLFCDFDEAECGRLSAMATTIRNLYLDRVRLVFRQFPLTSAHPGAHLVAQASLAAHAQGKFWAFHDVVFGNPHAHDRAALDRYAEVAGLELGAFRAALDRGTFAADVDADLALGRKLGITTVPAVYRNGKSVKAPFGAPELDALVGDSRHESP